MSIRLMSIVWDIPWPSQSALLIALKLADYANDEGGSIHPSRDTLAKHAQTSLATVKRTLAAFKDIGLLQVVQEGGKGRGKTTKYQFDMRALMRLHDGYDEVQRNEAEPEKFILVTNQPVDACGEVGAHSEPQNPLRGSGENLRGSGEKINGSIAEPRTTNLDSPIRTTNARAREVDKSDLEKSGRPLAAIRITPADGISWQSWIDHLRTNGHEQLAHDAEIAGLIVAPMRFPKSNTTVLPKVDTTVANAKAIADRMIGESAA